MNKARVVCLIAGTYTLYDGDRDIYLKAKPLGIFRKQSNNAPKVGDIVDYQTNDGEASITKVEKRKNDFVRPAIANIDQAFLVFSVKEPDLNLNLLDKFLVLMESNDIDPILIFNKWDLLKDDSETIKIISYYESLGYKCIKTNALSDATIDLKQYINGKYSILTGQSGVGKSTILNQLAPHLELKTNEISQALGRGKHTTRHVEFYPLYDGWVADTPGFGDIDLSDMPKLSIANCFREFLSHSRECKYNGCLHINEPKCKIKELVEKEEILKSRYENYLYLINETNKEKRW